MKQYPRIYCNLGKSGVDITIAPDSENADVDKIKPVQSWGGLKEVVDAISERKHKLADELRMADNNHDLALDRLSKKRDTFLSRLFSSKDTIDELEERSGRALDILSRLQKEYDDCKADIDIKFDPETEMQYSKLSTAFSRVCESNTIWQIRDETMNPNQESVVKYSVEMNQVDFSYNTSELIKCKYGAFHMECIDGPEMFIYPAFVLFLREGEKATIIDLKDVTVQFHRQLFMEEDELLIPKDSKVVGRTWYRAKEDGTQDHNYPDNFQVSIVEYGALSLLLPGGVKKQYFISNAEVAAAFADKFHCYLDMLYGRVKPTPALSPMGINKDAVAARTLYGHDVLSSSGSDEIRPMLSTQYFYLLQEYAGPIRSLTQKLMYDKELMEKISGGTVSDIARHIVDYCVIYDMFQVLRMVCRGTIHKNSLEMLGLILLAGKMVPEIDKDFFGLGYEEVARSYKRGVFSDLGQKIIDVTRRGNPMRFRMSFSEEEDGVNAIKEVNGDMCLPIALKVLDSKLFDEYITVLYRYATIIAKADDIVTQVEEETLKNIYQVLHNPLPDEVQEYSNGAPAIAASKKAPVNPNETLEDVLSELESLPGLRAVKQEIVSLTNYIKVQQEREKLGLKVSPVSYHYVFTGSPGTGKTTIARMVAKIYMHLGVLSKGHLVETDRSGLIAGYVGQTTAKVNRVVNSALDGILFIDEAYALVGENKEDYGSEAVATLIKRIEDDRDKLVVIIAGYTEEMKEFIDTNPGIRSRFNRYIDFADYVPDELYAIFKLQCQKLDYILAADAEAKLLSILTAAYDGRDRSFGNGRYVRNIFEKTIERQANRIAHLRGLTKEVLTTITAEDIA